MKELSISVYDGIAAFYAGNFPGGEIVSLDAKVDGIGLPMETSRFETFTQASYDAIYAKLVADSISIFKDTDEGIKATDIDTNIVKVTLVN